MKNCSKTECKCAKLALVALIEVFQSQSLTGIYDQIRAVKKRNVRNTINVGRTKTNPRKT